MIQLPAEAQAAVGTLEAAGYEAFAVGGCVRDLLMGREPHDVDITTNAAPDEIEAAFSLSGFQTIPTGKKHGTITVLIADRPVEVTTYRMDGVYIDARRPESVTFAAKVEEDLARRDFTVNAMAYSDNRGLVDCFGGQEDLANRCIRTVGTGERRFSEDALRILRAFRFSAQLGFRLTEDCRIAAYSCRELLWRISAERVTAELQKLLISPSPDNALRQMRELEILDWILPPAEGCPLDSAPEDLVVRIALLFASLEWEDARERIGRLRLSNAELRTVLRLLQMKETRPPVERMSAKLLLQEWELDQERLFGFWAALYPAQKSAVDTARLMMQEICDRGECYKVSMLAVKGGDLTARGLRGPAVGEALERLLEAVVSGRVENEREALLRLLK